MKTTALGILALVLFAIPASASQPGHPLDCTDWVFSEPGHSCVMFAGIGSVTDTAFVDKGRNKIFDNQGRMYHLRRSDLPGRNTFLELVQFDGATNTVIASIRDRDYDQQGPWRADRLQPGAGLNIEFDATNGRILIPINSYCEQGSQNMCGTCYQCGWWIAAIDGFAPLFEILQTPGPEGPAGPAGPGGPQGPQGVPGPLIPACPDTDGDGWADCTAVPGCYAYGHPCGDCDDTDPTMNPRGSERKPPGNRRDHKDNDCNGVIDG